MWSGLGRRVGNDDDADPLISQGISLFSPHDACVFPHTPYFALSFTLSFGSSFLSQFGGARILCLAPAFPLRGITVNASDFRFRISRSFRKNLETVLDFHRIDFAAARR